MVVLRGRMCISVETGKGGSSTYGSLHRYHIHCLLTVLLTEVSVYDASSVLYES